MVTFEKEDGRETDSDSAKNTDGPGGDTSVEAQPVPRSAKITSYVTTAARACVANRDEMYKSFMESTTKALADIAGEHDKLEYDEKLWKDNWEKLIERLLGSTI